VKRGATSEGRGKDGKGGEVTRHKGKNQKRECIWGSLTRKKTRSREGMAGDL